MTSEVVELIPLLHGDSIRPLDARRLIKVLHESRPLREACRNLGYLVTDLDESIREERFMACLHLLLSWTRPEEGAAVHDVVLDPNFLTRHRSFPSGLWKRHITVVRAQDNIRRATSVSISSELAERIRALQDFWGVCGYAVK